MAGSYSIITSDLPLGKFEGDLSRPEFFVVKVGVVDLFLLRVVIYFFGGAILFLPFFVFDKVFVRVLLALKSV